MIGLAKGMVAAGRLGQLLPGQITCVLLVLDNRAAVQTIEKLGAHSQQTVTVFLRPLSPCDLVRAESKLAARATPFHPSPLRHKRHGAKWAPNIRCSNHLGCCVARTFHLPSFVFSRSLRSVFHTPAASMVLFRCFKWVAIRRARIAVEGF
jgi:hypothetical protein